MKVEIDSGSGFCFGVTRAISKAEEELTHGALHCLGDIVHNGRECDRLRSLGLNTIDHGQYSQLPAGSRVLLRAHGEPPATYQLAKEHGIQIIDATCPVVLHLQERIKREYDLHDLEGKQIVIFGKRGHAEVLGLVGQTEGTAIVIETPEEAERLDMTRPIALFSQTTKSIEGFRTIVDYINQHIQPGVEFRWSDTICRQVGGRLQALREFAASHDVVLFVCGKKSSNGRVLFTHCQKENARTFMVEDAGEICREWFERCHTVGVCGATSTPAWLMQQCKVRVEEFFGGNE